MRSFDIRERTASSSIFLALAGKKLVRFQEYATLYPEATFVFIGDNGQARAHPRGRPSGGSHPVGGMCYVEPGRGQSSGCCVRTVLSSVWLFISALEIRGVWAV